MTRKKIYRRCLLIVFIFGLMLCGWYLTKMVIEQNPADMRVSAQEETWVYPCGIPVGLYLKTEGVMVIASGQVSCMDGTTVAPADGKIMEGDYITAVNGDEVNSKSQLLYYIQKYGNHALVLDITRNGENTQVKVNPVSAEDGSYRIGVWVRDDTQGIGTLTYIKKDGSFGALGHGISDVDTGKLLASNEGTLYQAFVWGIRKGEVGVPGGLCGVINYEDSNIIGQIDENMDKGIYGEADTAIIRQYELSPMVMAYKDEVEEGNAYIRCLLDGKIKDYEIEILKVNKSDSSNKGLVIEVTDEELLNLTGGIVQGMSGSPIIQNGKLIGAVTHVFVQDPAKGYGIFIEQMLEQ